MCNFTFTLLDELSTCVVSCWCTLHIGSHANDLMLLASHTKLPSPHTPHMNAIHKCMFHDATPRVLNGIVVVSCALCLHAFSM
jgi:hypothetical protein